MIHSRLSQPPITSPAWILMRSFSGMLISSSTVQGLFTWPLMLKSLVPLFLVRPKLANQSAPRLEKQTIIMSLNHTMFLGLPADSGSYGHGLHVGHCGGAAEDANISREGRLQARFTWGVNGMRILILTLYYILPCLPSKDSIRAVSSPQM